MFDKYILRAVHHSLFKAVLWITYMDVIFDFYCQASHMLQRLGDVR